MRTRRGATIQELRNAIDCLPRATRIAMLDGIRTNEIIAGAYTDRGGVCPMLAAHRAGGRTNFIGFARAWDQFAFGGTRRRARARRATRRELLVLTAHLEASLLEEHGVAPSPPYRRRVEAGLLGQWGLIMPGGGAAIRVHRKRERPAASEAIAELQPTR
jgi:hypothetical protein